MTEVKKEDKVLNLFTIVGLSICKVPMNHRVLESNCMKMKISTDLGKQLKYT